MGGKRLRNFNQGEFETLCKEQRTLKDICNYFCTTEKTLYKWVERVYKSKFSEVFEAKKEQGRTTLINYSIKMAQHNPSMAIFLLKNWCGYSDQPKPDTSQSQSLMQSLIDIHKQTLEQNKENDT